MAYEQFVVSGSNAIATIGALLQQKTMMAVQETVMQTAVSVGSSLRRSASVLRMRPISPALSNPGPPMSNIWTVLAQDYINIQTLSSNGGQSTVYEAWRRQDSFRVVIKHMNLPTEAERKYFNREVDALRQFSNHPYCLQYCASSIVGNEGVIITPFMPNRDLNAALNREAAQDQDGSWPTIKSKIAFRLAATIKYIHGRGFVHRDIKPMNVFLNSDFEPVLGDWGLARNLSGFSVGGVQEAPTFAFGTPYFMAPELYGDNDDYSYEVDVFAWGILIYAMFAAGESLAKLFDDGQIPRSSEQAMQKIQRGTRYKYLTGIPSAWWILIQQCWNGTPSFRPTMAAIVDSLTRNPSAYMFPGTNEQQLREFARTLQ
jgi:serine/threonine protein kinase